jgi:BRCA1/BRCA2-containing complex subunit 3
MRSTSRAAPAAIEFGGTLQQVKLTWDAYFSCCSHALSTEKEEIMGLCLGDWENDTHGRRVVAVVHDVLILVRSDRRKDRVEISPEQMAMASGRAEELGAKQGRTVRVIGWYHSHPHITVVPSHVDVRTQAQWQQMDQGFIGLIFGERSLSPQLQLNVCLQECSMRIPSRRVG